MENINPKWFCMNIEYCSSFNQSQYSSKISKLICWKIDNTPKDSFSISFLKLAFIVAKYNSNKEKKSHLLILSNLRYDAAFMQEMPWILNMHMSISFMLKKVLCQHLSARV